MTTIRRHNPNATEEVEVPEWAVVCDICNGAGYLSGYDRGWRSLMPSSTLSAMEACVNCEGVGFVEAVKCTQCGHVYTDRFGAQEKCPGCGVACHNFHNQAHYDHQEKEWRDVREAT